METTHVVTFQLIWFADANITFMILVFLPIFLIVRTVKRAIPSLLGGG